MIDAALERWIDRELDWLAELSSQWVIYLRSLEWTVEPCLLPTYLWGVYGYPESAGTWKTLSLILAHTSLHHTERHDHAAPEASRLPYLGVAKMGGFGPPACFAFFDGAVAGCSGGMRSGALMDALLWTFWRIGHQSHGAHTDRCRTIVWHMAIG